METLKEKVKDILNTRFVSHKNINALALALAKMLKEDSLDIKNVISELVESGDVVEVGKNKYAGTRVLGLVKGKFTYSTPTYGFVLNENGDIFVSRRNFNGAFDGDEVLVKIIGQARGDKKREGKILKILTRDNDGLLGTFHEFKRLKFLAKILMGRKRETKLLLILKVISRETQLGELLRL